MLIWRKRKFTEDIDFATIQAPSRVPRGGPFKATIIRDEIARKRSGIPFAAEFRQAIEEIANRHPELAEDWLNDEAAQYLYEDAPNPDVQFWQSFDNLLYVYLPTREYVLATKLMASRDKDVDDIESLLKDLKIKKHDQLQQIIDTYLSPDAQQFYEIEDKLDDLFA